MKPIILAAVLLLTAGPLYAGDDTPQLNRATVAFIMGATIDWSGTAYGMSTYHNEGNPLINWWQNNPTGMIALGAAIDTCGLWAVRRIAKRTHHERLAAIGLYGAAAFRAYLGYRNIRDADARATNLSAGLAREFQKYEPYRR